MNFPLFARSQFLNLYIQKKKKQSKIVCVHCLTVCLHWVKLNSLISLNISYFLLHVPMLLILFHAEYGEIQCQHGNLSFLKVKICWRLILRNLSIGKHETKEKRIHTHTHTHKWNINGWWHEEWLLRSKWCLEKRDVLDVATSFRWNTPNINANIKKSVIFSHSIKCRLWMLRTGWINEQ